MTTELTRVQRVSQLDRVEHHTTTVESLVTDVVSEKQEVYPEAEITAVLPGTMDETVPTIVRKAIDEAIDNAVGAVSDGEPDVTVAVSGVDADWVEIDIRDNGPGLPETEASVLETGEETPLSHGEGFGVWTIRMMIQQADGDVTVSATDEGTTLRFRLPR